MNNGFVKVAAASIQVSVADTEFNKISICNAIDEAVKNGAKIVVLPELCLTGYTCSDLFLQEKLINSAKEKLFEIADCTKAADALIFVGLPLIVNDKLYNCAAAINRGNILGIVPKVRIPNYSEFYELRHFNKGNDVPFDIELKYNVVVPFGTNIIFECDKYSKLKVAAEICEDVWAPNPPSNSHGLNGATVIVNLSASDETTGKDIYRRNLINGQSARMLCGYVYANAGEGESTTDLVFGGHSIISENGLILAEAKRFENQIIYGDIDVEKLLMERVRMTTFEGSFTNDSYRKVKFKIDIKETSVDRKFDPAPFVPSNVEDRTRRCEEILSIQSMGLKKRLKHTGCKNAVVGISGGLDSTLALLVTVRAFDMLGLERENIIAVTMPCFGTTDRTYNNAVLLIKGLNATFKEVDIKEAVTLHFKDIEQDINKHDVTYENSQARERTQVLMDIANKYNGMVIGTGDMSELALGWATYNGDHMSMYGVNASVPKTLVRHLVRYYADTCGDKKLTEILLDILDTPVSPELLPPQDGKISQKTEDIVGPYELHDFFLYYILRFGFEPSKVFRIAKNAFEGIYTDEVILKCLLGYLEGLFLLLESCLIWLIQCTSHRNLPK